MGEEIMTKSKEMIAYIDRPVLRVMKIFQGYNPARVESLGVLANEQKCGVRGALEKDTSKLQLIPYAIIERSDGKIMIYKRSRKHTEQRLASQWSVGIGGHTKCDESVVDALRREIHEELNIDDYEFIFRGYLLDNSTAVSMVHLGIVFHVFTKQQITPSDEIADYEFIVPHHMKAYRLESWSMKLADHIYEILGRDRNDYNW